MEKKISKSLEEHLNNIQIFENAEKGHNCPICLEDKGKMEIALLDSCQHLYCSDCIITWIISNPNSNCPLCKKTSTLSYTMWLMRIIIAN